MTTPDDRKPRYRLYTEASLDLGVTVALSEAQAHYLGSVMRAKAGEAVALFNGREGEWRAIIDDSGKHLKSVSVESQRRPQTHEVVEGPWLLFAPLKKQAMDMVIEKATELGASVLWPILTRYTNAERVNVARLRAQAIEAAEQCERLSIPEVREPTKLTDIVKQWPAGLTLLILDESGRGASISDMLTVSGAGDTAFLVGPEGGFAPDELSPLRAIVGAAHITLGPRILRADTAAIAALTCWQVTCGDWRKGSPRPMSHS